jgi:hypothetical protein
MSIMLISLIITIVIILTVLWLIDMLPVDYKLKIITRVIVIIIIVTWLLCILTGVIIIPFADILNILNTVL